MQSIDSDLSRSSSLDEPMTTPDHLRSSSSLSSSSSLAPAVVRSGSEDDAMAVDESDFECGLCLSLLIDPITIPCGHTFCQPCLVRALEVSKKQCPTCRCPCMVEAQSQPVNILISSVVQKYFPKQFVTRKDWATSEKKQWQTRLSVFFMGTGGIPFSSIGLRLFEPRYLLMARRALASDRRFGFMPGVAPRAGSIGTVVRIESCHYGPDGSALVSCRIRERFRVVNSWIEEGTAGLTRVQVEIFSDDPIVLLPSQSNSSSSSSSSSPSSSRHAPPSSSDSKSNAITAQDLSALIEQVATNFRNAFGEIDGKCPELSLANLTSVEKISFFYLATLAARRPLDFASQLSMLELRNPLERLKRCDMLVKQIRSP